MGASCEAGLVERLRRRDARAFAQLWLECQGDLWTMCLAVLGGGAESEAALRDTIELGWAECEEAGEDAGAWLKAVCGRVLLQRHGRDRRSDGQPRAAGLRGAMLGALDGLSRADRVLLALHHLGGLGADEIARMAELDARRVRQSIHRGRLAIVAQVEEGRGQSETTGGPGAPCALPRGGTHVPSRVDAGRRHLHVAARSGGGPLRHR